MTLPNHTVVITQCEQEGAMAAKAGKPRWKHPYSWEGYVSQKDKKAMVDAFHRGYDKAKQA